MNIFKDI